MNEKVIISKSKLTKLADTTRERFNITHGLTVDNINDKIHKLYTVPAESAYINDFVLTDISIVNRFQYSYILKDKKGMYLSNQQSPSNAGLWYYNIHTNELTEIYPVGFWNSFIEFTHPSTGKTYVYITSTNSNSSLGALLCEGNTYIQLRDSGYSLTFSHIDDKGFYYNSYNYYYNIATSENINVTPDVGVSYATRDGIISNNIFYRAYYFSQALSSSGVYVFKNGVLIHKVLYSTVPELETLKYDYIYVLSHKDSKLQLVYIYGTLPTDTNVPVLIELDLNYNITVAMYAVNVNPFNFSGYTTPVIRGNIMDLFPESEYFYSFTNKGLFAIKKDYTSYTQIHDGSWYATSPSKRRYVRTPSYEYIWRRRYRAMLAINILTFETTVISHPSTDTEHYFGDLLFIDSKYNLYLDTVFSGNNITESVECVYISSDTPTTCTFLFYYNIYSIKIYGNIEDIFYLYKIDTGSYTCFYAVEYGNIITQLTGWPSNSQGTIVSSFIKDKVMYIMTSYTYAPAVIIKNFNNMTHNYTCCYDDGGNTKFVGEHSNKFYFIQENTAYNNDKSNTLIVYDLLNDTFTRLVATTSLSVPTPQGTNIYVYGSGAINVHALNDDISVCVDTLKNTIFVVRLNLASAFYCMGSVLYTHFVLRGNLIYCYPSASFAPNDKHYMIIDVDTKELREFTKIE